MSNVACRFTLGVLTKKMHNKVKGGREVVTWFIFENLGLRLYLDNGWS